MNPPQTAAKNKAVKNKKLTGKLEAVLASLCRQLGPLTKTKAVKLPYLVDVLAAATLGRRVTRGTHQTWEHGVVTREVFAAMRSPGPAGVFRLRRHNYSESGLLLELEGKAPDLSAEEEAVVSEIARRFGTLDAEALGALTKSLNSELSPEAWGENHLAAVDAAAYLRMAPESQDLHRQLPILDLDDPAHRGQIGPDPRAYLRRIFSAK